ncbi:MAG: phage tail protein, partial [Limosilactobacillus sp.]|nr:phage tail protein [Limosilactobacillus sp.]
MMNITLHNADDKQVALQAYSVALTNEINSYPTVNFMFNATGHNALVEDMLDEGSYFEIDGQQYRFESSNPVPNSRFRTYTIDATHIGVMLEDNFIRETVKGKQSLDALAKLMISDLKGWSYKIDDKFDDVDLGDDETEKGHGKAILDLIVEKFGCEYWFDNRCIHFCKTVGKGENNASFLFVDQMNASHIAFTEDFTNFKT